MAAESKSFELLEKPIQKWIWQQNWAALRDIQEQAIPHLLKSDKDAIIAAATASGKTEAAFLPLISRTLGVRGSGFNLVYIGPLKALINDQFRRLEDLCEKVQMPVHPWHGDIDAGRKARARQNPQGILLITPESLEALFVRRGLEVAGLFHQTDSIVIDELHVLLDSERGMQLRSLMNRMELATGRRIRRVGLSATLGGDMNAAKMCLRNEDPEQVRVFSSTAEGRLIQLQLRGLLAGEVEEGDEGKAPSEEQLALDGDVNQRIAEHLQKTLRGSQNLVFAGSRMRVELLSDCLRELSEKQRMPLEFFPHHANLATKHRQFVEQRLREGREPTTAICTSTLELGIDIGAITSVAQIEAPFSVAALHQRLGRSGRRSGQPAIMRLYVSGLRMDCSTHPIDVMRFNLARAVAMVELMLEGWCEPPRQRAMHLSTLVQQILSFIVEHGGTSAETLFDALCKRGPFSQVEAPLFARLLRCMGDPETQLIEQVPDGTLLLGSHGERLVEHYEFYAAFMTPREYRVVCKGKTLGTIPMRFPLAPQMAIIFVGQRWEVLNIDDVGKTVEVQPARRGVAPSFAGSIGPIHDTVIARMRTVLADSDTPKYLDATARQMLEEGRHGFRQLGLAERSVFEDARGSCFIATWAGTIRNFSLMLALQALRFSCSLHDGLIEVGKSSPEEIIAALRQMAASPAPSGEILAASINSPQVEKYHKYLSEELLHTDTLSSRVAPEAVPELAAQVLGNTSAST